MAVYTRPESTITVEQENVSGLRLNSLMDLTGFASVYIIAIPPTGKSEQISAEIESNKRIVKCNFDDSLSVGVWKFKIRAYYEDGTYKEGSEYIIKVI